MPNHVTTIIECNPRVADGISRPYTDIERLQHRQHFDQTNASYKERTGREWERPYEPLPERFVDFEMVVPSPPNKETGGCSMGAIMGIHVDTGEVCWYEWNQRHWGTKWNAYEASVEAAPGDQAVVKFDTAWSTPLPVIVALSRKFPEDTLHVQFADEDLGSNLGEFWIKDGEVTEEREFDSPREELDFASQIKYGRPYADMLAEWGEEDDDEDDQMAELVAETTEPAN